MSSEALVRSMVPSNTLSRTLPREKKEIAAVLCLINRIAVVKITSLLFPGIQGITQTRRINPTLTYLTKSPSRALSPHGLCNPGQFCGVGNCCKAITFFTKIYLFFSSLLLDIFMTIQYNLCRKRWVRAQLDYYVPPFIIYYMK